MTAGEYISVKSQVDIEVEPIAETQGFKRFLRGPWPLI